MMSKNANELVTFARGVLAFDTATYVAHTQSRDALKRGLLLMVIVALLANIVSFVGNAMGSFRQVDLVSVEREVLKGIEQGMQFNPAWQDPKFRRYFEGSFSEGFKIGVDIANLPYNASFLPHWLNRLLHALGTWLSQPLAWLGAWAWYALWVMLFAKLLGGRATLVQMLGATALFAVPHGLDVLTNLLNVLSGVQFAGACLGGLGTLTGLAASIWGIAVYVKATATAHEFSLGKATLAAILPVLLVMLLAFVGLVFVIVAAALGSR